ncbi:uncharacterized protein TNCT_383931 [Trichonephila clavata]|uniref:Paired domain-containing protein n=1 Tax=Trichonephila clavata TaxID=2740835 RepID=A0A8X6H5L0_TRICU|nr:uncharacterized protein TNCT_383931 [Trichonephila clavata]
MVERGKSLREIASLIGVTHGCVQKILQKYKKTGSVANIPGRGRKEILSTTAKRKIIHSVKKDPRTKIYETFRGLFKELHFFRETITTVRISRTSISKKKHLSSRDIYGHSSFFSESEAEVTKILASTSSLALRF